MTDYRGETVFVKDDELEMVLNGGPHLYDQLREMIRKQKWTTQDEATMSILQEMKNVLTVFLIRKSDHLVIAAVQAIEQADYIYGNVYIMRDGYRANGVGTKLMTHNVSLMENDPYASTKTMIGRAAGRMIQKYQEPPLSSKLLWTLYKVNFESKTELLQFFPQPQSHDYQVIRVRDMTPSQWEELKAYDALVTGQDRSDFLKRYYSVVFVEGLVIKHPVNGVQGMIGTVPTIERNLYKLNPLYTSSIADAGILVHELAKLISDPTARFVCHVREDSAGDQLLDKCKAVHRKFDISGVTYWSTVLGDEYVDRSRRDLIFAPTNSPAHFDG